MEPNQVRNEGQKIVRPLDFEPGLRLLWPATTLWRFSAC